MSPWLFAIYSASTTAIALAGRYYIVLENDGPEAARYHYGGDVGRRNRAYARTALVVAGCIILSAVWAEVMS